MRLFYLQNEKKDRIPLNNETGIFLSSPEGLGLEFGDTFADIGEGFYKMVSKKHNQRVIGGNLLFMKNPYKIYNDFITWCMTSEKLYLIYKPEEIEYYIHVEIESMQKTEINKLGYMEVPVKLKYLSPWYVPYQAIISVVGDDISAFTFGSDLNEGSRLDGNDVFSGSYSDLYTSEVHASGHLPAAVVVSFTGVTSNPVIKLVGRETGIEYGRCAIAIDYGVKTTIELSTMYEDSYIKSIDLLGNETDLLPYIDLTSDPFFKIPLNEDCILSITDDNSLSGQLSGYVYCYYRSV